LDTDLFWHEKLGKRLSREDAKEVIEFMHGEGRAEWIGKGESETWIWWRNVEEWAGLLYEWVSGITMRCGTTVNTSCIG
jgi:ESCRT-II complex subunit VPS25